MSPLCLRLVSAAAAFGMNLVCALPLHRAHLLASRNDTGDVLVLREEEDLQKPPHLQSSLAMEGYANRIASFGENQMWNYVKDVVITHHGKIVDEAAFTEFVHGLVANPSSSVHQSPEALLEDLRGLPHILRFDTNFVRALGAPEMCKGVSISSCRCAIDPGFQTFSVLASGDTRCFTTYLPPNSSGPRPVVFVPNVYAYDDPRKAKDTMLYYGGRGIASVFVSKPTYPWRMPASKSTVSAPQYCQSEDVTYIQYILSYLDSRPDVFDTRKMYIYGFSVNSMFSSYIGYCLSERFQGIFQSSGALIERNFPVATELEILADDMFSAPKAMYFPIYPCYEPSHPITNCFASGIDDPYVWTEDLSVSMNTHAYDRTVAEGQLASIIVWTDLPGHKQGPMREEFVIGCLGIYSPCSAECWNVKASQVNQTCAPCAATQEMLIASFPATTVTGSFGGPPAGYAHKRPASSTCAHKVLKTPK